MRDVLRYRVYSAQTYVTGAQRWSSTRDAAAFIRAMERDIRFKERYPNHKPVRVFRLKERGAAEAYYSPSTHGVYLPYWAQNALTLVHELTHAANPGYRHGAAYCRELHWMVRTFLSERQADELREGFEANDIKALNYDNAGRVQTARAVV